MELLREQQGKKLRSKLLRGSISKSYNFTPKRRTSYPVSTAYSGYRRILKYCET
jgi:hypothetical protein